MHRLSVMAVATCAAMAVSSIADAQQPAAAPPAAPSRSGGTSPSATWTLFLVTVLYKSGWSVTPVAAFSADKAEDDCQKAKHALLNDIPGVSGSNAEAARTEGNTEFLICLHATAAQQSRSSSTGPEQ